MIQPSPQYDMNNEAQFRSQIDRDALQAVRADRAITSLLWVDEADGLAYRVTLNAGAFVFTLA